MAYEHIASFYRSRKWLLYYWGVLQYALSVTLAIAYHCRSRKIVKKAAKVAKKVPVKSSALIADNEEPIIMSAASEPIPTYQQNALV